MEEYLLTLLLLLVAVALAQTSYLVYRTLRKDKRQNNKSIFVDTSVLMDGRILEVAKAGFITDELVIPRTVIGELQLLSDGSDSSRRTRARHGLDVARELRTMDSVSATLLQDGSMAPEGVDERLLKLAKKHGGAIMTIDFNLNKVAQVEDIPVMNINELAKVIRAEHLPGERYKLELIQKGQNQQQAVGYTKDGIMVVVDNAQKKIGTTVDIEITRAIQTDAGRMLFAKIVEETKMLQTPKPGIAKKLLNSGGRQRSKAVKSAVKLQAEPKSTSTPKSSEKPAEKHHKQAEKPVAKAEVKSESRAEEKKQDRKPDRKIYDRKKPASRVPSKEQAPAKTQVPKSQDVKTKSEDRPRLFSSRSDVEPTQTKREDRPKSSSSVNSGSSSKQTKPSANTPKSDNAKPQRKPRKNPEEDLMKLINNQ